jgi:hypothetical protein
MVSQSRLADARRNYGPIVFGANDVVTVKTRG